MNEYVVSGCVCIVYINEYNAQIYWKEDLFSGVCCTAPPDQQQFFSVAEDMYTKTKIEFYVADKE